VITGLISRAVSDGEQGELQGALASLGVAAEAVGPPIATAVFGYFTSAAAPFEFPGAGFVFTAVLGFGALAAVARALATEQPAVPLPAPVERKHPPARATA